jgi:hypothetical protein
VIVSPVGFSSLVTVSDIVVIFSPGFSSGFSGSFSSCFSSGFSGSFN